MCLAQGPQHSDAGEAWTRGPSVSGQALYHWATALLKVTRNVAQYPLHHVTYPATEFEVATSNPLGGDTFTRKYIIWSLTLTFGSRSHKMLPSTLNIMWPIQLQSLKLLRQKV